MTVLNILEVCKIIQESFFLNGRLFVQDVIRQAEAQLQLHSSQPGFGIALLKVDKHTT